MKITELYFLPLLAEPVKWCHKGIGKVTAHMSNYFFNSDSKPENFLHAKGPLKSPCLPAALREE